MNTTLRQVEQSVTNAT